MGGVGTQAKDERGEGGEGVAGQQKSIDFIGES